MRAIFRALLVLALIVGGAGSACAQAGNAMTVRSLKITGAGSPSGASVADSTLTHTGARFSLGNGTFAYSTQPANAFLDMIAPNDRHYDNVLTIENKSVDPITGNCGNAAFRFRAINQYEKGAVGYSRLGSDARCLTGFFPNTLYMEGGNLGPDGNSDDTDIAWVMTHVPGSKYFAGKQHRIFWAEASTGILRMVNSSGDNSHVFEPEAFRTTFRGVANHLRITGAPSGSAPEIAAIGTPGSDFNIDLSLRSLGTGRILVNGTPLSAAATTAIGTSGAVLPLLSAANTWGGQQTLSGGLSVTGTSNLNGDALLGNGFKVRASTYALGLSGDASISDNAANGITIRVGSSSNYRYFLMGADGAFNIPGNVTSGALSVSGTSNLNGNVLLGNGFSVRSSGYNLGLSGNASIADNGADGITIRVGPSNNYRYFFMAADGTLSVPSTVTAGGYAVGPNVGVSCSGSFTNNLQVINGIVTRC